MRGSRRGSHRRLDCTDRSRSRAPSRQSWDFAPVWRARADRLHQATRASVQRVRWGNERRAQFTFSDLEVMTCVCRERRNACGRRAAVLLRPGRTQWAPCDVDERFHVARVNPEVRLRMSAWAGPGLPPTHRATGSSRTGARARSDPHGDVEYLAAAGGDLAEHCKGVLGIRNDRDRRVQPLAALQNELHTAAAAHGVGIQRRMAVNAKLPRTPVQ